MRVDGSALAQLLQVVDDHFRSGSDDAIDQPVGANLGTELHGSEMGLMVIAGDVI